MFQLLLWLIFFYWLASSLTAYFTIKRIFKHYSKLPHIEIKSNWKGFIRNDLGKWNQNKILQGCFTKFPWKFGILIFFIISYGVLIMIWSLIGKRGKNIIQKIQRAYGTFAVRTAFKFVQQIDYSKYQIDTPLVICNHTNWFDVWYLGLVFMPLSAVSKDTVKKIPVVGTVADFHDVIFVERGSSSNNQKDRDLVVTRISERIQKFKLARSKPELKQRVNPLIIFPQGTTSNGHNILTFKMGAFNDLAPITMFTMKYKCEQFQLGMGDISQLQHTLIMCSLSPTIEVKHQVIEPKPNESAEQYCRRARQIMSQMTGFQKVECGYRDWKQYQNAVKEAIKKSQ